VFLEHLLAKPITLYENTVTLNNFKTIEVILLLNGECIITIENIMTYVACLIPAWLSVR